MNLASVDSKAFDILTREGDRQEYGLEMIASENFVSKAVMQAMGTCLTNKYAEGYPSKRYYGGCEVVDEAEDLAIARAKKLFGAEHVNVQPHSGSGANMAVYMAMLKPGDTILAMDLAHGGHLTHGSPVNFSGKLYNVASYGVNPETGLIDYDEVEALAKKHQPKMIVCGASAYARTINFDRFGEIAKGCGALLMADIAHIAGLVATGHHPSPMQACDFVTTTTHKTLRGPRGGMIMCKEKHAKKINSLIFPGIQGGPLMHVILAKAVAFGEALEPSFAAYSKQTIANAQALAEGLQSHNFSLISGGTDNHLVLVDVRSKNLTGKVAEKVLDKAGITTNKNMIPNDPESPFVTSGLRLGTPALTTRGMLGKDMLQIATWIDQALVKHDDPSTLAKIKEEVKNLCTTYPLYK